MLSIWSWSHSSSCTYYCNRQESAVRNSYHNHFKWRKWKSHLTSAWRPESSQSTTTDVTRSLHRLTVRFVRHKNTRFNGVTCARTSASDASPRWVLGLNILWRVHDQCTANVRVLTRYRFSVFSSNSFNLWACTVTSWVVNSHSCSFLCCNLPELMRLVWTGCCPVTQDRSRITCTGLLVFSALCKYGLTQLSLD